MRKAIVLAMFAPCALAREITPLDGPWDFSLKGGAVQEVRLPHTWNAIDGADGAPSGADLADSVRCGNGYARGLGEYVYKADITPKPGKRYFIRLEGASIVSEVLVNGSSVGKHVGAFTASCYEITDSLKPEGGNTICVKVDNSPQVEVPPLGGDFTMFGGLYRPVSIIETDALCIDPLFYASSGVQVRVDSLTPEAAKVDVRVRLNGKHSKGRLTVEILDAEGEVVAGEYEDLAEQGEGVQEMAYSLMVDDPHLWQGVADPYMYQVKVTLTTEDGQEDSITEPLAFRTVQFDAQKGFVLNGKPMQLRGVSRHQDVDGKGWAVSPEDEARDVQLIKDMGVNAVRTAHYPQSANMYDLMDAAGFVVWTEVPCVNQVRDTAEFKANAAQQAKEMIYQLGNHPSICMWGVFNEIYHQVNELGRGADMEGMLTELNAVIKETDPSRDTVSASNQQGRERLNRIPDHIAFNIYPGWYGGSPASMAQKLDSLLKQYGDRCLGVSEYGHGAGLKAHEIPCKQPKPLSAHHPEEWQSFAHEQNYAAILARPRVWGTFVWNMFDFGSDARGEGERHGINDKGLVSYDRAVCKDAYFFYKAQWNPEPMVYITSRRYTNRPAGTTEVKVYSNAGEVALSVNGKELGKLAPDAQHRAIWKDVPLAPGKNVIKASGRVGDREVEDVITVETPEG